MPDDLPVLFFDDDAAWEQWLAAEHANARGVWLKFAKKGTGIRSLHYPEALDVALCYGWIDGQLRRLDDTYHLQRFTPRRARSTWSKINRENVAALIDAGRMKPAGMAEIERAKADGRWDAAYDSPALATVPDDLQEALKQTRGTAVLCVAGQREPLRDPVPDPGRKAARDPRAQDCHVRRDARTRRNPLTAAGPGAAPRESGATTRTSLMVLPARTANLVATERVNREEVKMSESASLTRITGPVLAAVAGALALLQIVFWALWGFDTPLRACWRPRCTGSPRPPARWY